MARLVKCDVCHGHVSDRARYCPNCHQPMQAPIKSPMAKSVNGTYSGIIVFLLLAFFIYALLTGQFS